MGGPLFTMTVEGRPVPKGRPKAAMAAGHAIIYTPGPTRAYELQLAQTAKVLWRQAGMVDPIHGPLQMSVTIILPKPKTVKIMERPIIARGTYAGDIDNFVKTALDALNGIIFFDDAQIVSLRAEKFYGAPAIRIEVDRL